MNPADSTPARAYQRPWFLLFAVALIGLLGTLGTASSAVAEPEAHVHLGGWGGGDRFPDLPAGLFGAGTDMSDQQLRSPFPAGEAWQIYSDENYPAELYGNVRPHARFDPDRVPFDLGVPGVRSQEVLAMGSGYAIASCLTENMAIIVLEIQGHGRFLYVHMDRSELPDWIRTDEWTAVAQGQSLGRLWDNVYPNRVVEYAADGCSQLTFGEHLHLEVPAGTIIDGMTVGEAAPNIGDVIGSTNVLRPRPTCNGQFATLVGSGAGDTLQGTNQNDVIIGLGGGDVITGQGGNDVICGGSGADQISGGAGNDQIVGGNGNDACDGGIGNDNVECESSIAPTFTCDSNAGALTWTNDLANRYWVYKSVDGGSSYNWIGRTVGSPAGTSFTDSTPSIGATYQVHYQGIPRVECSISSEPTEQNLPFACASNGGALTWSDHAVGKYWVYKSIDGGATFNWIGRTIGSPAPTSFNDPLPSAGARYQVHYQGIPRVLCSSLS